MSSPVNKLVLIDVIFEIERNSNLQMLTWTFLEKKRTLQTFHDSEKKIHQDVSKFHVRYFPDSSCKESALINYWREISEVLRVVTFVLNPYGGSRSSAVEIKFPFC